MKIDESTYKLDFSGIRGQKALEQALDIRKFEIEMYWKRASYFWTLIAASFAGYGLTLGKAELGFFSTVVCCVGLVFSVGWSLVIKGSKQWQENWENHVEMLEDCIQGPLYKTVLRRPEPQGIREHITDFLTGPAPFSVAGINQIISYFTTLVWLVLLVTSLQLGEPEISWPKIILVTLSAMTCCLIILFAKTHIDSHTNEADKRGVNIS